MSEYLGNLYESQESDGKMAPSTRVQACVNEDGCFGPSCGPGSGISPPCPLIDPGINWP